MASNLVLEPSVEQGVDAAGPEVSGHVQGTGRSAAAMAELRRVQLANEGMRLLLTSEVRKAEELFKASRFTGPELNAGYSFVQFVRALMSFEDDIMDFAYKSLEGTEKFCDTSKKLIHFFNPSSAPDKVSAHERLYRKSIVADCLLFEAVLVFVKQGVRSYVKGGYILRKAWKMYEKIYQETEELCSQLSPITNPGFSSPIDKHVGSSLYDKDPNEEQPPGFSLDEEEEEGEEVSSKRDLPVLNVVEDGLPGLQLGFGGIDVAIGAVPTQPAALPVIKTTDDVPDGPANCHGNVRLNVDRGLGQRSQSYAGRSLSATGRSQGLAVNGDTATDGSSRTRSDSNLQRAYSSSAANEPDGGRLSSRTSNARPQSGLFLPEDVESSIDSLHCQDDRLRGAVYFGYGLMNIIMSLIPPNLKKLANLFGFHGNRRVGLQALEFASNSQDMKAPLARIALLWYHTIIRPFFALDGENEGAGSEEAERLLAQVERKYAQSPLFLYFRGKIFYLRCQLEEALDMYTRAAELARDQREVEHICLYEKGWIHFLRLEYAEALPCYLRLKNETRWSACYYAYLGAAMSGVLGKEKESRELFLQSVKLVKRKNNNLEKFCARRGAIYKKGTTVLMPLETQLMVIEIIYLWRALPFCSQQTKEELVEILRIALPPDAQPFHCALRAWLCGGILNALHRTREAEKHLQEAMQYDSLVKYDKHIFSFSLYELAMIHIGREEYARARTLLQIARDNYTGYEFEARLNFKVHSALHLCR